MICSLKTRTGPLWPSQLLSLIYPESCVAGLLSKTSFICRELATEAAIYESA